MTTTIKPTAVLGGLADTHDPCAILITLLMEILCCSYDIHGDWEHFCRTSPADVNGVHFPQPTV